MSWVTHARPTCARCPDADSIRDFIGLSGRGDPVALLAEACQGRPQMASPLTPLADRRRAARARSALAAHSNAVLVAPPGAGKTTRAPLALLDEPWAKGKRLILLEPRRLAARAAAARMAATLGEKVGETIGLRVRLTSLVSKRTRIEVVTEGVFTRMILDDPSLEGVAGVLFDEFHERSLDADLGLALALDAQEGLREDLRLLVMSATLDGARVRALLGQSTIAADRKPRPRVPGRDSIMSVATRAPASKTRSRASRSRRWNAKAARSSSSCRAGRNPPRRGDLAGARQAPRRRHRAALRRAGQTRAGPRHRAGARGAAQDRARHLDRRDVAHH